jgi:hypothetical protein
MPLHEAHYQHWEGIHTGIWRRRWVIAQNGLAACLRTGSVRRVAMVCWMGGLMMTGILFFMGQLLLPDSIMAEWTAQLRPELQGFARMLTSWLVDHPEISIGTVQNVLFYYYCEWLVPLSIFALGMTLPLLITRDMASNAIVIYSSKAVTRGDYVLGKFCTAFGVMALTWLGPVCAAWFAGNLLAPGWSFFWYAREPLFHALIFGLSSMVILSLLALGVSAVSSREKATPALWFTWWVLGIFIQPIALKTLPWLRHASFHYNLSQIELATFHLGRDLKIAQDNVPIFGQMFSAVSPATRAALDHPTLAGAIIALALMLVTAGLIVRRRVKPE